MACTLLLFPLRYKYRKLNVKQTALYVKKYFLYLRPQKGHKLNPRLSPPSDENFALKFFYWRKHIVTNIVIHSVIVLFIDGIIN